MNDKELADHFRNYILQTYELVCYRNAVDKIEKVIHGLMIPSWALDALQEEINELDQWRRTE